MKNFIRLLIPLLVFLINKTVYNKDKNKKRVPSKQHEPLLQIFQEVTGIPNFNLHSTHSSNSFKSYSDFCRNFKKNIHDMKSQGGHELINKLIEQIDKIDLTYFDEFARDYVKLIIHNPTLMPMSNLYLYR